MNCQTCKHWGANKPIRDHHDSAESHRLCMSPKVHFAFIEEGKMVDHKSWADDVHDVLASDEAAVQDGSGYWAAFFTGPDFGCNQWEALP